jgi:hypothetical protein
MVHPSAGAIRAGEQLVQHLVEDDELHEEGGDLWPIEGGMDADLSRLMIVQPESNRFSALLEGHSSPTDLRPDSVLEEALIEALKDFLEVEAPPERIELRVGVTLLTDEGLAPSDEIVEHRPCLPLSAAGVVGDRAHHWLGGIKEHVVQAQPQVSLCTPEAHHRRSIVGDRKADRDVQVSGKAAREVLGLDQYLVARWERPSRFAPLKSEIEQRKLERGRWTHDSWNPTRAAPRLKKRGLAKGTCTRTQNL